MDCATAQRERESEEKFSCTGRDLARQKWGQTEWGGFCGRWEHLCDEQTSRSSRYTHSELEDDRGGFTARVLLRPQTEASRGDDPRHLATPTSQSLPRRAEASRGDTDLAILASLGFARALTFSLVTTFIASFTFPMLPAPNVFCSCQSPIILRPFSFTDRLVPASAAFLLTTFDASAVLTGARASSLMVGSCGCDDGNDPGGSGWCDVLAKAFPLGVRRDVDR